MSSDVIELDSDDDVLPVENSTSVSCDIVNSAPLNLDFLLGSNSGSSGAVSTQNGNGTSRRTPFSAKNSQVPAPARSSNGLANGRSIHSNTARTHTTTVSTETIDLILIRSFWA